MNRKEAFVEAARRWGSQADVGCWYTGEYWRFHVFADRRTEPIGIGRTWEEAFADADKYQVEVPSGAEEEHKPSAEAGRKVKPEIRRQQEYLRQQNKLWKNFMDEVPRSEWPPYNTMPVSVWRSDRFLAQVFSPIGGVTRISILRTMIDDDGEWLQDISWDDLMDIKSEIGFERNWAVEIFPDYTEVMNVANMRHLWVLPEPPAFAWRAKR